MAYISEIEAAIRAIIDVGTFQNLCNEILRREINAPITSLGSQSGTNKTTFGTPDAYFYKDDKYVFVEYTTTENESTRLFNKINSDLEKCFDENSTKIPLHKIAKIIYCHTSSNLSTEYTEQIQNKCHEKNVVLEIWGINELSHKIKDKYPAIAQDYLHLDIGNGQIFDLLSFIEKYDYNETAASLETKFLYRENELAAINNSINENKITVLTGSPGVGKTRLAIELLNKLSYSCNILCIRNNYSDFGNDFSRYISLSGQNIIFVDDANTFDNRLLSILDLLNNPNGNIKILMTVRESFVSEIERKCLSYSEPKTFDIKSFSDAEIEGFLKNNFNINNQTYIKQIQRICEGNARLAYFAGKMALDEDGYRKIQNAEQLFENYYDNFLSETLILNDKTIITAGIISVAGMLDKNNLFNYDKLFGLCKITKEEFIHDCDILNEKEILNDLNGNISIDEQCMNNYFVYLFLYKKKYFTLEDFFKNCYEIFPDRVVTSFNNIIPVFYSQELLNYLSDAVKNVWNFFIGKNLEEKFVKAFCNLDQENALLYIYDKIEQCSCNTLQLEKISFDDKRIFHADVVIDLIGQLARTDKIKELMDLLCKYIRKSNDKIYGGISVIKSRFKIDKNSFETNYYRENQVIDSLLNNLDSDILKLFFIECSRTLLSLTSEYTEEGRHRTIVLTRLITKNTNKSRLYREKIWNKLIEFAKQSFCCDRILNNISVYASGWDDHTDIELLKFDSLFIKTLLEELYLYNEMTALNNLYKINEKLSHFNLSKLELCNSKDTFLIDVIETFHEFKGNSDERDSNILAFINRNPTIDSEVLIKYIYTCTKEKGGNFVTYNFERFLDFINDNNFYELTKKLISFGKNLNFNPSFFIKRLWIFVSKEEIHGLIWDSNLENKNEWQFFYFATMPKEIIKNETYNEFIDFLSKTDDKDICSTCHRDLDFIKVYKVFDSNCYITIYSIVRKKYQYNSRIFEVYTNRLFNNNYTPAELCSFFENDLDLLFDIYFLNIHHDNIFDYEGKCFIYLLDHYEVFRIRTEKFIIEQTVSPNYIDSLPNVVRFVVKSECFEEIIDYIFDQLAKIEIFDYQIENLSILFSTDFEKIKRYVHYFIDENFNSEKHIKNLFLALIDFDWTTKHDILIYLINKNDSFELFSSLELRGSLGVTTTGGFVAEYESELRFWENLLKDIPNEINYIRHRQFCSSQIQIVKKTIENEKIREKYTKRLFFNE